jgi:FG-GAP-like repeat
MTSCLQRAAGTTAVKSVLLAGIIAATIGILPQKSAAQADPGATSITTIHVPDAELPTLPQATTSGTCHIMPPKTATGEPATDVIRPDCEIPLLPGGPVRDLSLPPGSCVQSNCNPMTYQGGAVITQTQHKFVFLNCTGGANNCFSNYGGPNTNPFVFVSDFFSSNYIHVLDQYMVPDVIKTSGRYQTSQNGIQVTATVNHVIYDADVQNFILLAINNNFNPNGGGGGYNQMYSFFLPQGQDLCFGSSSQPSTSCYCPDLINPTCGNPAKWSFCGYHNSFNAVDRTGTTIHVIYQALPYANASAGNASCQVTNGPNGVQADSQNTLTTHELAETITDPDGNGWFRSNTAGEIGDICNFIEQNPIYLHTHAYSVQTLYSNAALNCVGATRTLALSHNFNFDDNSDLAWRDSLGNTSIWLMNGAGVLSSGGIGMVPTNWLLVGQRDFDGDGKADLLWRDNLGNTSMWFMNGTLVSSTASVGNIPNTWSVASTGDFNGDGKGDLLWRDGSGNLAVWLMNGNSVTTNGGLGNVPTNWQVVGTGDFNGDGMADLVWRDNLGNTSIWFMNGLHVQSSMGIGNISTGWSVAATGDFNGDGMSDIVWRDGSGNTSIWLMNGAVVLSSVGIGNIPTTFTLAGTGDYNGDGLSDLVWRDNLGNTSIWFMNGTAISSQASIGNVPPTWTVQTTNAE